MPRVLTLVSMEAPDVVLTTTGAAGENIVGIIVIISDDMVLIWQLSAHDS